MSLLLASILVGLLCGIGIVYRLGGSSEFQETQGLETNKVITHLTAPWFILVSSVLMGFVAIPFYGYVLYRYKLDEDVLDSTTVIW